MIFVWILVICGMWIVFSVFGGSKISMMASSDKIGWSRIALIVVAIVATKMKVHTNLEVHIEARGWRQRVMTCWLALSNRILVSFEGRTVGSHVPIAPHQLSQVCSSLKKGISDLHSLNRFIHCHISAAYLYLQCLLFLQQFFACKNREKHYLLFLRWDGAEKDQTGWRCSIYQWSGANFLQSSIALMLLCSNVLTRWITDGSAQYLC